MSWVAVAVGVGSAAAGAYGANRQNSSARDANRNAGQVDITHTNDPYGPSTAHRDRIMNIGSGLYDSRDQRWGAGPGATGGGGAGAGAAPAAGRRKPKPKPGGGGQPAAPAGPSRTDQLADDLAARARGGHELYDPANAYTTRTLAGEDSNPYRSEAAGVLRNLEDPNVSRYLDFLYSGLGAGGAGGGGLGGSGGGGGGGGRGFSVRMSGGGGGDGGEGPVGAAAYTKEILDGKYLNEGNPYRDALIDSITDRSRREFQEGEMAGINAQFSGAGRFGSNAWQEALAKSAGRMADSLGGTVAGVEYEDYNARMGDVMGALGIGAQLDMSAADRAERSASAGAASAASAYGADREAQLRERLALIDALGGATGMSAGLTEAGALGLRDISSDFSADQRFALGAVPDLSGLGLRDLATAGDFSLGIDNLRSEDAARRASASNARAGIGLQQQALNFDRFRYSQEAPWNDLARWGELVNAMSGGYGTSHEVGTDRRSQSPQPYANVGQQALAGGLAGFGTAYGWGGASGGGGSPSNTGATRAGADNYKW